MDEKTFNLIFKSRSVRSVHHRVVMEALRYLEGNWADLFLKEYKNLLEGSKAPDKRFKDFRNHVCHMPNGWGGAKNAVKEWYGKYVEALRARNWKDAAYNAGVMSHYYADVNHPFHTGQTSDEGKVHSYTEFGAAEIYMELRELMTIDNPVKVDNIEDFVFKAAKEAYNMYEDLLVGFDVEAGDAFKWGKGYTPELKKKIAPQIARAIWGTASLFKKGIEESKSEKPEGISLTSKKVVTRVGTPTEWARRWNDRRWKKKRTRMIRKEKRKFGRVRKSLLPDDKDYHKALDDGEIKPVALKGGISPKISDKQKTQVEKDSASKQKKEQAVKKKELKEKKVVEKKGEEKQVKKKEAKKKAKKTGRWAPAITHNSDIEDAAEVGPATAKRLTQIGLKTVSDFVKKPTKEIVRLLKEQLNYTRLDLEDIDRMQKETQLMLDVPRLRVHDVVVLYSAGITSKEMLLKLDQDTIWKKVQEALKTDHSKKYLSRGKITVDLEEIGEWKESAQG